MLHHEYHMASHFLPPLHDQVINIDYHLIIQELVVGKNYFDSSMPTEIGNLTKLRNLTANDNLFEGKFKS